MLRSRHPPSSYLIFVWGLVRDGKNLAADTGETSEAGGDNPEPAESEDEEDNDGSEDEGYEGGSSDEGDLLYEFNVSRQRDGTYSSR